jgi:hypothetical protein
MKRKIRSHFFRPPFLSIACKLLLPLHRFVGHADEIRKVKKDSIELVELRQASNQHPQSDAK